MIVQSRNNLTLGKKDKSTHSSFASKKKKINKQLNYSISERGGG